ncbi:MAG: hypothetical protein JJU31_00290 [Wenzhouxiangella sp.]|nr:hypothetical protein [Wenzhouxiangella sp.]TVR91389.1 MAG: hypothetical protein EA418_14105 [Wenzhouxiangellaceae bacterium]
MSLLALSELSARERQRLGLDDVTVDAKTAPKGRPDFLKPRLPVSEPKAWWQACRSESRDLIRSELDKAAETPCPNPALLTRAGLLVG